jgi:IclR family KDG regulon transcriptional repressor
MKKQKIDYSIQTVANGLKLLEAFRNEEELGVTELSRRLDLHKNNVFRLLATLELAGYIEQSPTSERYRLGISCLELGQSYLRSRPLLRGARPLLEEVARKSGESSHLGVLRDFEVVHLDGVGSEQLVGSGLRVGQRLPVHCTALGKVLLGHAPEDLYREFSHLRGSDSGLGARTPATIVDSQKFFDQLRSTALRGYAVEMEECETGLSCAAAPVFGDAGQVVAAISVSGPAFRMGEERLHGEIVPLVTDAAGRLSRQLGFASQAG